MYPFKYLLLLPLHSEFGVGSGNQLVECQECHSISSSLSLSLALFLYLALSLSLSVCLSFFLSLSFFLIPHALSRPHYFFSFNSEFGVGSGNQLVECQECHSLYHQECHAPPMTHTCISYIMYVSNQISSPSFT